MITAKKVHELLEYDQAIGVFLWKVRQGRAWPGAVAGTLNRHGHRTIRIDRKHYLAHRLALLYMKWRWPVEQIDHINGQPDDNRFVNLREATPKENSRNAKRRKDNTSGVVGVGWNQRDNCWHARIKIDKRLMHIGYFKDFDDAVKARKRAEREHGFHANHGER